MDTDEDMEKKIDVLFEAVHHGDIQTAIQLIEEGIDPNRCIAVDTRTGTGSILYNAVRKNQTEVVKKLLEHGADTNFIDEEGETPIFSALYSETDPEIRNSLFRHGANMNHINKAGNTPLMNTAINSLKYGYQCTDEAIFHSLYSCKEVTRKNSKGQSLIHMLPFIHSCVQTLEKDEHDCVRFLRHILSKGELVNTKDGLSLTPLHYACSIGCLDSVQILLGEGADVTATSLTGENVVHSLGKSSNEDNFPKILDRLIECGCSIHDTDNFGRNILHYIVSSNNPRKSAVQIVLKHGLDIAAKDAFGLTSLHLCTIPSIFISPDQVEDDEDKKNDISELIEMFVANGAEINAMDKNMLTPLHYILRYKEKPKTLQAILSNGADINVRTKTGETGLHRATLYVNLLEIVLDHATSSGIKIDFNARDNFGSTALHWSVYYFEPKAVDLLLEHGASTNIQDCHGRTPVQYAIDSKRTQLFENLGVIYSRETFPLPFKFDALDGCESTESNESTESDNSIESDESTESYSGDEESVLPELKAEINTHQKENVVKLENTSGVEIGLSTEESLKESKQHNEKSDEIDPKNEYSKEDNKDILSDDSCSEHSHQSNGELVCIGKDHMWCDCPILQEVFKRTNDDYEIVDALDWLGHISKHKRSIAAYLKHIIETKEMGIYLATSENKEVADCVHMCMKFIAKEMKKRNPLFEFELSLAGSWKEGTKIAIPEEFDYKLILVHFSKAFQPMEVDERGLEGYAKFALKEGVENYEFQTYLNEESYLDSTKVVRVLYTEINLILKDLPADIFGSMYPVKYLKTEKGSIDNLSFRWIGPSYKNMLVDVDVVPTLVPPQWNPSCINTGRRLLARVSDIPYSVVMKTPDSRFASGWNSLFRISVADREVAIFSKIPKNVLKGYILVKSLFQTLYFPQIYLIPEDIYLQRHITTYILKTCFLHELERGSYSDKGCDGNDQDITLETAKGIVKRLQKAIEKDGKLDSYFISGVNLLAYQSLTRFNGFRYFECEIYCLKELLKVGMKELAKE